MFEFVNTTTAALDQDDNVKRKIRSHAMKDYRARQRKDRRGKAKEDGSSTLSNRKPSRLTFKLVAEGESGSTDHEAGAQSGDSINSEQAIKLSLSPSSWGKETPDVFQSPMQLQQMFGLCREWFHWLRPDIKADFAGKPIDQAWSLSPCPMLLAANCLAAVGGLDAADRSRPSGLEVVFKGRVLHEIQIRMQSSIAATTDETMSTLLFLVSLNSEAITHLKGLRSILRLKGQHRAGMKWGGGMVLETLDLLTALWQGTDPLMTSVEEAEEEAQGSPKTALKSTRHRAYAAREAFKKMAIVLNSEQANSHDGHEPSKPESAIRSLLDVCTHSLDTFWEGTDTAVADDFFDHLSTFSSEHCECEKGSETQLHHVARAFHQTMAIFYNVTMNRHPFPHNTNQHYVDGIIRAVTSIHERTWKPIPYLRYLALLTGALAAREACDKSFFHTHLGKCQMVLGITKWPEAKRFIVNFLRFERGIEPRMAKSERRTKHKKRLQAAAGSNKVPEEEQHVDVIPMDGLLSYTSLSWHGEKANTGLEELLTNDRTFHEAMLSGAFWKTE